MSLLEVTLEATYQGQQIINRFNYVSTGTPASISLSTALLSAMGFIEDAGVYPSNTVFSTIRALQVADVTYQYALGKVVYSDTDFYEVPFVVAAAGTATSSGEGMPGYVSIGFRTNRVKRSVRRGTRRFCGVGETNVGVNNTIATSFRNGAVLTCAQKMSAVLTYIDEGNTLTFSPVICGKERYTTPNGHTAYRYFPTESVQLQHTADGILWESYASTRSQVSRQLQRGR